MLTHVEIQSLIKESGARSIFMEKWIEACERAREKQFEYRAQELTIHFLSPELREDEFSLPNLRLLLIAKQKEQADRVVDKWKRLLIQNDPPPLPKHFVDLEVVRQIPIESTHPFEKLRRIGERSVAVCPFHAEKTPSFMIYHTNNSFYCFGGCHTGGDNITFVRKLNDCGFKEACQIILSFK